MPYVEPFLKMNETGSFAEMWMDLETVIHSKSEREKQILYINAYMWNLEDGTDKPICRAGIEMKT